jgi:hypothetical protein
MSGSRVYRLPRMLIDAVCHCFWPSLDLDPSSTLLCVLNVLKQTEYVYNGLKLSDVFVKIQRL